MQQGLKKLMKHVSLPEFGAPDVMKLGQSEIPQLKENQSLVEILSTSINRADTLQRQGKYPAPKGITEILGLECAGYELDSNFNRIRKVMSIIPGGGYAEYVAVCKDHLIEIPDSIPIDLAGGICEIYLTAYLQLRLANMKKGNKCLVYAAGSGVGQATLQLCNIFGITGIGSCSLSKQDIVQKYTKNVVIRDQSFEDQLKQIKTFAPQGVDAVFDCIGQQNYKLTIDSLGLDGRWILYGLITGGVIQNFNLAPLLAKRVNLINTTLRSRSDDFKSELIHNFQKEVMPHIANGQIKIPVDKIVNFNWDEEGIKQFVNLHKEMESNQNAGKLIVALK